MECSVQVMLVPVLASQSMVAAKCLRVASVTIQMGQLTMVLAVTEVEMGLLRQNPLPVKQQLWILMAILYWRAGMVAIKLL